MSTHEDLVVAFRDVMSHAQRLLSTCVLARMQKNDIGSVHVEEDVAKFEDASAKFLALCQSGQINTLDDSQNMTL